MKGGDHPDIAYLMQDDISKVLIKGLTETYKNRPGNPVDYFAKWLLNFNHVQVVESKQKEKEALAKSLSMEFKWVKEEKENKKLEAVVIE